MIAAILKPLAGLFDLVPGWLWALAVAGLALTNCATHMQLERATSRHNEYRAQVATRDAAALAAAAELQRELQRLMAKTNAKHLEAIHAHTQALARTRTRVDDLLARSAALDAGGQPGADAGRVPDGAAGPGGGAGAVPPGAGAAAGADGCTLARLDRAGRDAVIRLAAQGAQAVDALKLGQDYAALCHGAAEAAAGATEKAPGAPGVP